MGGCWIRHCAGKFDEAGGVGPGFRSVLGCALGEPREGTGGILDLDGMGIWAYIWLGRWILDFFFFFAVV